MRLLTFKTPDGLKLGIKTDAGVIDVAAAAVALKVCCAPTTMDAVIALGDEAVAALTPLVTACAGTEGDWLLDETNLALGPCVPNPEKLLCVGLNYRRHAAESGMAVPEFPVLFSKFNNALTGADADVAIPPGTEQVDYEVELAVVMGKTCKHVSVDEALDYVMGYTNANDLSIRELQMLSGQWLLGKTSDGFCPLGPYLITADEVPDPQDLETKSWLNGELRQNSNTSDMIFTVAEVIAYASQYFTLKVGDVLLTGTPEGVILGMDPKVWMKPGDVTTVEVGDFGKLTNTMVKEQ